MLLRGTRALIPRLLMVRGVWGEIATTFQGPTQGTELKSSGKIVGSASPGSISRCQIDSGSWTRKKVEKICDSRMLGTACCYYYSSPRTMGARKRQQAGRTGASASIAYPLRPVVVNDLQSLVASTCQSSRADGRSFDDSEGRFVVV